MKKTLKPEPLTADEVTRILKICNPQSPTGARDRALITVWYRAGLRLAESLSLLEKDLNRENGTIRFTGKGDKPRVVGMDEASWVIMDHWLKVRRKKLNVPDNSLTIPVFCSYYHKPMHGGTVRNALYLRARKAGVVKRVHPHGFRHTCAYEMVQEGVVITTISKHLGHSNLATTHIYLDHLTGDEAAQIARRRTWDGAPVKMPPPPKPKTDLDELRKTCEEGLEEVAVQDRGDRVLVIAKSNRRYRCFSYLAPCGSFDGDGDWRVIVERDDADAEEAMVWMATTE